MRHFSVYRMPDGSFVKVPYDKPAPEGGIPEVHITVIPDEEDEEAPPQTVSNIIPFPK